MCGKDHDIYTDKILVVSFKVNYNVLVAAVQRSMNQEYVKYLSILSCVTVPSIMLQFPVYDVTVPSITLQFPVYDVTVPSIMLQFPVYDVTVPSI